MGTGNDSERGTPPRMPRWVKVSVIAVGVVVVVLVVLQLAGVGGQHGPGRHTLGGAAVPAAVIGDGA
jgi:hypothetical protein